MVKSTDNDNIIKVEPKEEEKKVESTSEKVESASEIVDRSTKTNRLDA